MLRFFCLFVFLSYITNIILGFIYRLTQGYVLGAKLIPADLPYPGIKARSPALQADSLPAEPQRKPQDYWSEYPIPSPTDLPHPGMETESPA